MSVEQMRAFVAARYPGRAWQERVKKMSDSQILAIYYRLLYFDSLKK